MRNFVIVGTIRTGSSVLAHHLSFNPDVACGWEWTKSTPWLKKFKVAAKAFDGDFSCLSQDDKEHMSKVFKAGCKCLGYRRLFSSSPNWIIHPRFAPAIMIERMEGHLRWFARNNKLYIIHIIRSDSLDWLKSVYLAKQTGFYVAKSYPQGIKVKVPIREAVARIRSKEWVDSRLATLSNSNPYLRINYEDFDSNNDDVTATALKFIGCVQPLSMQISMQKNLIFKQSKGPAANYILNYKPLFYRLDRLNLLTSSLSHN